MRVNSDFAGLFAHRLVIACRIALAMILGFSTVSAAPIDTSNLETPPGHERELRSKQVNLLIRLIGHQLLLQAGDSTSLVMPVTEVREGTFMLQLEKPLIFSHDSLIALSQNFLPEKRFPSGYTITVHDCLDGSIVYGFQLSNSTPDILACKGRSQPAGCYLIEFAFTDLYEGIEPDADQPKKEYLSLKADTEQVTEKSKGQKTANLESSIEKLAEEVEFAKEGRQKADPKHAEFKSTASGYPLANVIYTGMLISLGVTLLIARFGINLKPQNAHGQNVTTLSTIVKEPTPEFSALGKFSFDVKGQRLLLESEVISLTDKECKILQMLNQGFGELVPRETLMQEIWISEGVITGRSLDMFVSKLRKKLSGDPELRITNVHGKGYKLEGAEDLHT